MTSQTVTAIVEGGKATAAPPLGPQLGPLGVNTKAVIDEINEKTKNLAGMKVPIKVIVHEDKAFDVEVGTPPVSALIKKELSLEKASQEPGKLRAGDLSVVQAKKIAKTKFGADDNPLYSQVVGTARSMGVSVGEGAVTEEEVKAYEEQKAEEVVAEKAKEEAREAAAEGEVKEEEKKEEKPEEEKEKPAEEEKKEEKESKEKK